MIKLIFESAIVGLTLFCLAWAFLVIGFFANWF